MVLNGFQKMTLLDYPGKVACTLFTAGCNFRCPFCHNALLVTDIRAEDRINEEDVLDVLRKR
ncbi:MAG: 4Fe-4S cluster-binding domain-containing protein, partial [Clostridia bacterium]|nr:4Fe-4S cluster-binding domain-containing protein [Clostridia bacterium]